MSLWILDTDHVSLLFNRYPQLSDRVAEVGADVAITIVTMQELFNGWVVRINAASKIEDVVRLYGKLSRTIALCQRLLILDFDPGAGDRYQSMLKATPLLAKKRMQKDMWIAAIALALGATIVTRNHRDFSQVPGLLLEDWAQGN